jgi:transcription elongation factor Elf1
MTYFFKCPRCLHEYTLTADLDLIKSERFCHCGTECKVYVGNRKIEFKEEEK